MEGNNGYKTKMQCLCNTSLWGQVNIAAGIMVDDMFLAEWLDQCLAHNKDSTNKCTRIRHLCIIVKILKGY